jgi:hypothetical protein
MANPSSVKPSLSVVKPAMTPPPGVPLMGLAEAAKACGVSVSTIRRKRDQLTELGAAQTANGWHIPVTALIEAGLMERTTPAPSPDTPDAPASPSSDALTGELEALRAKLADAERRAAVAEAIAAERERMIQTQAMALRMLESAKTPSETPPPATPVDNPAAPQPDKVVSTDPAPRRRWWHRL